MFKALIGNKYKNTNDDFLVPEVQVDGQTLLRNGLGTRKRLGFSVYDMALYLPKKTESATTALQMPGIKQIRLLALRDISGGTLASAFLDGVRKNTLGSEQSAFLAELNRILTIFKREKVVKNDTFHIELHPEQGALFYINKEQQGQTIQMKGFNEAILGIWLGEKPADADLKQALLKGE